MTTTFRLAMTHAVLLAAAMVQSGCALFTPPIEHPIIEDRAHADGGFLGLFTSGEKVTVFSTTAARRSVLVKFPKDGRAPKICAEAPPDTADALISSLTMAASLQGKSADPEFEANLKAEFARTLSTTVNALTQRSQGLQLLRDGAFHLCLAWQNGVIGTKGYQEEYDKLLIQSSDLIKTELTLRDSANAATAAKAAAAAQEKAEAAADLAMKLGGEVKLSASAAAISAKTAKTSVDEAKLKADAAEASAAAAKVSAEQAKKSAEAAAKPAE